MASKGKTAGTSATKSKKRPNDEEPSTSKKAPATPKKSKTATVADDNDWDGSSAKKEKPKGNSNFWKFKKRDEVPAAMGSKEIPEGPEDCLEGLDFVITGVLDSILREDAEDLIKRHGGQVKTGVSKKTSYLLTGRDPGESKMKKANELKTKIIDEDGLFGLIWNAAKKPSVTKPATSNGKPQGKSYTSTPASPAKKSTAKPETKMSKKPVAEIVILDSDEEDAQPVPKKMKKEAPVSPKKIAPIFNIKQRSAEKAAPTSSAASARTSPTKPSTKPASTTVSTKTASTSAAAPAKSSPLKPSTASKSSTTPTKLPSKAASPVKQPSLKANRDDGKEPKKEKPSQSTNIAVNSQSCSISGPSVSPAAPSHSSAPLLMWVDKYAPKSLKNVVGQHTPASPANKLVNWLTHWHQNRKRHGYKSTSAGLFAKPGGDGSEFKAVLLSGPPGLGKTTTATLACQEVGFTFVHLNASDSRSKKILDDQVAAGVGSHSLLEYFSADGDRPGTVLNEKSALIMDEVDGMAGNEDRGGMAQVIQLIKNARIPVICICNDRSSQKIRSLAGYCFDLRFQRPRIEQIRGAMLSVCAKEGIKIAPNALDVIIQGAHSDMRQTLHNLYSWTISKKTMSYDEAKASSTLAEKDSIKMGPFEATRLMFQASSGKRPGSLVEEKMDLYFEDYNFVPLFVQENYLNVKSHKAKNDYDALDLISKAADSLSLSDLIDREIRGRQNWSLLPIHAVFSAVIPGNVMQGHMQGMITFPAWLGKNSTTTKNKRLIEELRAHMHLRISTNVTGLNLDYLPVMRRAVTVPLKRGDEGIEQVVNFVNSYDLSREDIEPIMDVTTWEGMKDPLKDVPPAVKSSLTRQLNKGTHLNPYSSTEVKKGRGRGGAADVDTELLDEETKATLATDDVEDEPDNDDKIEKDPMIKAKKPRATAGTSARGGGAGSRGGKAGAGFRGGKVTAARRGKK